MTIDTLDQSISAMMGLIDYRIVEPLDRPITAEERALAVEIGEEIAARHGIDLAARVAEHNEMLAAYRLEIGEAAYCRQMGIEYR